LNRERWYGSWRLGEQLEHAAKAGMLPKMIVVGIASDDGHRSSDLAPSAWQGSSEGNGVQYGEFIASTVVPAIDERFRTIRDRRCRGIGGASLGGVSALDVGLAHPSRFGMVLSLSPVLADQAIADHLEELLVDTDNTMPSKLLADFDDDAVGTADLAWLRSLIGSIPDTRLNMILTRSLGGRHRIASWAKRVIPALTKLMDVRCG
jgi:enterochelin esterase-like enzyme